MSNKYDFIVVGGGIVGLASAYKLQLKFPNKSIAILEKEAEVKIYDRSLLILDIFLYRAQTAQAKTQVELARSQYLLPRLTNMWSHLERQRGGTGTRGGSGEKELETETEGLIQAATDFYDREISRYEA